MSTLRVKYPRTRHLPWSPGVSEDDEVHADLAHLAGRQIVVTEKIDGENTTIYRDHIHARSLDSAHHPSRSWVKALAGRVGPQLPEGWRVCGENCFAAHSLHYTDLPSYFLLFSIWDEHNRCLSWDETLEWAALLDLHTPTQLYRGRFEEGLLRSLADTLDLRRQEGYVVRLCERFFYADFGRSVAKWVRSGHVTTDPHWMQKPVVPNRLRGEQ